MKLGAMNHPQRRPEEEIRWMAEEGFDFVDLTAEPPGASPDGIDVAGLRNLLKQTGLGIVGHTAPYLPLAHPYDRVRRAAVEEFVRCAEFFAELGASHMNIHPDPRAPMHDRDFNVTANLRSLREMLEPCKRAGIELMVENIHGGYNTAEEIGDLLGPIPELGLHLDIGHCHLEGGESSVGPILAAWGERLTHVHIHDNFGGEDDLHLPLGAGTLDLAASVRALKSLGYDGTVTLEVYASDRTLLTHSVGTFRRAWSEIR